MGIEGFVLGIWNGKQNEIWDEINEKNYQDMVLESYSGSFFNGLIDSIAKDENRKKYVPKNEWYCICDLDEFHALPLYHSFPKLAKDAEAEGANVVESEFIDRITTDGTILDSIDPVKSIWHQFPLNAPVTKNIVGGYCMKTMLARSDVKVVSGHHKNGKNKPFSKRGVTYHFKWWGKIIEYQMERWHSYEANNLTWFMESKRLVEHLKKNGKLIV